MLGLHLVLGINAMDFTAGEREGGARERAREWLSTSGWAKWWATSANRTQSGSVCATLVSHSKDELSELRQGNGRREREVWFTFGLRYQLHAPFNNGP